MTPFPPANILSHQRGAIVLAIFTISTFSTFASLLLAARKLAVDPDLFNKGEALVALAQDGGGLTGLLRESGLMPLAREMARAAEEAEAMTHPGHAIDDAIDDAKAIFWQVAPEAFADTSVFADANLDPQAITDAMVANIKASPHRRDFMERDLNEAYFRKVCHLALSRMLADAAYVDSITPQLWRESLQRQGVQLQLIIQIDATTQRTEAKVDELNARIAQLEAHLQKSAEAQDALESGVSKTALIRLVRPIAEDIDDIPQAMIELTRAVEVARKVQEEGRHRSNLGDFVDEVLERTRALSATGEHRQATSEIDAALEREEAESAARKLRLLNRSIDEHLLLRDAKGAARQIERKLRIETEDPSKIFDALRGEFIAWYESGRDKGLRLDLEISIALAERCRTVANGPDQRGKALNDFGGALATLGERESDTARLEDAVLAFRAALEERTRERVPLDWAMTQMNLGNALATLGARESGTARLEEAVAAYRAALKERMRERVPLDWAMTQMNLGVALQTLGERESDTARLEEAVTAFHAALEVHTRERVPLDWAMTQMNLGNALLTLGSRESGTARLEEAVAAYCAALEEFTRERVPLDWAMTQLNLGIALATLGGRESDTVRLEEAAAAYRAALEEFTRERVPLDWALTQNNLGNALRVLGARESSTARLEEAVAAYRAALEERMRERVPLDWATTQNNLGGALKAIGERESGTARLKEAVAAYRAALEERTRERVPLDWALTQTSLGNALATLGMRERGRARLEDAVLAYRAALEERTRERVPLDWANTTGNQGAALLVLAERTQDLAMAKRAFSQLREAAQMLRAGGHVPWAKTFERQIPVAAALVERLSGRSA